MSNNEKTSLWGWLSGKDVLKIPAMQAEVEAKAFLLAVRWVLVSIWAGLFIIGVCVLTYVLFINWGNFTVSVTPTWDVIFGNTKHNCSLVCFCVSLGALWFKKTRQYGLTILTFFLVRFVYWTYCLYSRFIELINLPLLETNDKVSTFFGVLIQKRWEVPEVKAYIKQVVFNWKIPGVQASSETLIKATEKLLENNLNEKGVLTLMQLNQELSVLKTQLLVESQAALAASAVQASTVVNNVSPWPTGILAVVLGGTVLLVGGTLCLYSLRFEAIKVWMDQIRGATQNTSAMLAVHQTAIVGAALVEGATHRAITSLGAYVLDTARRVGDLEVELGIVRRALKQTQLESRAHKAVMKSILDNLSTVVPPSKTSS